MPLESLRNMLPPFYRLGTLADMTYMARKLALARKAIAEIRYVEDYLEAHKTNLPESELVKGMRGTQEYAMMVANTVKEAIMILKSIKVKVASYQESVHDAID